MHLAGVGMREVTELQIDDHEAPESPVKKYQIDAEPLSADPKAALPSNEGEVASQFE